MSKRRRTDRLVACYCEGYTFINERGQDRSRLPCNGAVVPLRVNERHMMRAFELRGGEQLFNIASDIDTEETHFSAGYTIFNYIILIYIYIYIYYYAI